VVKAATRNATSQKSAWQPATAEAPTKKVVKKSPFKVVIIVTTAKLR
jgi:hypothetical protein